MAFRTDGTDVHALAGSSVEASGHSAAASPASSSVQCRDVKDNQLALISGAALSVLRESHRDSQKDSYLLFQC